MGGEDIGDGEERGEMMERVDCDGGVAGVMEVAAADGAERARVSELGGGWGGGVGRGGDG